MRTRKVAGAIATFLAAVALPVASFGFRRQHEIELREQLRKITDAIDHYHDYRASTGPIQMKEPKALGSGDYPKKLEDLLKSFELTDGRIGQHTAHERVRFEQGGWTPIRGTVTPSQVGDFADLSVPPLVQAHWVR